MRSGRNREWVKPYPEGIEAWDHPYHGPDNNPQSYDQLARAPYLTQFIAEPKFSPMPEVTVSAGGVVFKAFGHIAHKANQNDVLNTLMGINAYNGMILWRRPNDGFMIHRNTMVATPGTLLLGDHKSCKFIDAQTGVTTGEIVIPEDMSDGPVWKWMALQDHVLYALIGAREIAAPTQRSRNPALGHWPWGMWAGHDYKDQKSNFGFGRTLVAIDIKTQKILWHHRETDYIDSRGVCMKGDRIYFYSPQKFLACLDTQTQEIRWRSSDPVLMEAIGKDERAQLYKTGYATSTFIKSTEDHIIFAGPQRSRLVVVNAEDGRYLWHKADGNLQVVAREDGFYVASRDGIGAKLAYDTGKVLAQLPNRRACTRATGSIDSIFYRTPGGTVRVDTNTHTAEHIAPMRPPCQDGVMISNGLLYWGPWMCGCQLSLYGHICLTGAGTTLSQLSDDNLELAPVASTVQDFKIRPNDWPHYGGDNRRSGVTRVALPATSRRLWTFRPTTKTMPTAPVAAGGLVFVADRSGIVRALDSQGRLKWKAYTGGPIYYPPTIDNGRLFVGSADGRIHAFEAASGKALWRYRVGPGTRLIPVFGKLISTWPVAGGVVAENGVVYAAAGIAHYDGTHVVALDGATAQVKWENDQSGVLSDQVNSGVSLQGELYMQDGELRFLGGGVYQTARFDTDGGECLNEPIQGLNSRFRTAFYPYYPEYAEYASLNHNLPNGNTLTYVASYEGSRHTPLALLKPLSAAKPKPIGRSDRVADGPSDRAPGAARRPQRPTVWKKSGERYNGFVVSPDFLIAAGQKGAVTDGDKSSFVCAIGINSGEEVWRHPLPGAVVKSGAAVDHDGRLYLALRDGQILCFGAAGIAQLEH